jgi:hypothetical protein
VEYRGASASGAVGSGAVHPTTPTSAAPTIRFTAWTSDRHAAAPTAT